MTEAEESASPSDELYMAVCTATCSTKTPDGPGLRNVEHWICSVFNKLGFGTLRPARRRTQLERPRCLPSCWSTGHLPATASEHRNVCLIDFRGAPQVGWYFSHV